VHEAFISPAKDQEPAHLDKSPPPPIVERPAVDAPSPSAVWIAGYWEWDTGRKDFVWVTGTWRVPPPGRFWVNGYWKRDDQGWYRVPGFWSERKTDRLDFRKDGPPADHPDDEPGPSPGPEHFYVPGQYFPDGDGVTWKPGFWAKSQPGWSWVPAQWVRQPEGWTFQEGYWDRTLDDRGTLFAPAEVDPSARNADTVYQPYTQISPDSYGLLYGAFGRPNAYYDGYPGCYYDTNGSYYGYAQYGNLSPYYGYLDYPFYGSLGYPYLNYPVSSYGYGLGYGGYGYGGLFGGVIGRLFGQGYYGGYGYPYGLGYGGFTYPFSLGFGFGNPFGFGFGNPFGFGFGNPFGFGFGNPFGFGFGGFGFPFFGGFGRGGFGHHRFHNRFPFNPHGNGRWVNGGRNNFWGGGRNNFWGGGRNNWAGGPRWQQSPGERPGFTTWRHQQLQQPAEWEPRAEPRVPQWRGWPRGRASGPPAQRPRRPQRRGPGSAGIACLRQPVPDSLDEQSRRGSRRFRLEPGVQWREPPAGLAHRRASGVHIRSVRHPPGGRAVERAEHDQSRRRPEPGDRGRSRGRPRAAWRPAEPGREPLGTRRQRPRPG
jgi:hypothetical protein